MHNRVWQIGKKALALQKEAYELRVKVSGAESPKSFTQLKNLSVCYFYAGDNAKAIECMQKAYELSRKAYGETHPTTIQTLYRLASTCATACQWGLAATYAQEVYDLYVQTRGVESQEAQNAAALLENVKKEGQKHSS